MSDISDKIVITRTSIDHPDCIEYKATLHIEFVGYLSKELQYQDTRANTNAFDKMVKQLKSQILDIVYKDVITKLDALCQELLGGAKSCSFDAYDAKLDAAQKLRKLANELRGA